MTRTSAFALLPLSLLASAPLLAQDTPPQMSPEEAAMMAAYQQAGTPGDAHAALAKMAGDYTLSIRSWNSPGAPPSVETGSATRRMILGGRVLVEEMQSQMYGQPYAGHGMSGYDNVTGKYWSSWNDSMSTGIMLSQGDCGADGACTFHGSWNDPVSKDEVKARMTTRWTSPAVEVFEMYAPGADGKESLMMEITYTRK